MRAVHLDAMQFTSPAFRRFYTDTYIRLVDRLPRVWGWLYQYMHHAAPTDRTQSLRRRLERAQTRALLHKIATIKPDAIICTHFLPAEMLSYLSVNQRPNCPIWVQITDYDAHRMWIQPGVTGYFVGNEKVASSLRAQGVSANQIHLTGLPIMPRFSIMPQRAWCARMLALDPTRITILLMSGGAGIGHLAELSERLLAIDPTLQLIALSGRNTILRAQLLQIAARAPVRFVVQGHTAHVERFMACADIIVTKPGGLTSAECLAARLPMVLHNVIPGQEERNADFLVEQGVALQASDAAAVESQVRYLIAHPEVRQRMARQAHAAARPRAAADVLQIVRTHLAAATPMLASAAAAAAVASRVIA